MSSIFKPLISICLLCAGFAIAYVASAQTTAPTSTVSVATSSTTTTTAVAAPPSTERYDRLIEAAAATEGASLSVSRQKRIINLAANLSNRMDAALWRFTNIADRLESRLLKVEGGDFDTAEARLALSDARTSLGVASELLAGIDAAVVKGVTSNEPIHAMAELRAMYETISTALRKAHSSLRISVALLKAASETATETATTTPATVPEETQ